MTSVIVKINNGAVSSVLTDSSVVKVFVLDEDPLNGAPGVSLGDPVYAFDAPRCRAFRQFRKSVLLL